MRVEIIFCDLCEGDYELATANYVDAVGKDHDICGECEKIVRKEKFVVHKLFQSDDLVGVIKAFKERLLVGEEQR